MDTTPVRLRIPEPVDDDIAEILDSAVKRSAEKRRLELEQSISREEAGRKERRKKGLPAWATVGLQLKHVNQAQQRDQKEVSMVKGRISLQ